MAAKGNKNPEKWTLDESIKFFQNSLKKLRENESICFIGGLAVEMNTYRDIYSYLYNKFKEENFVFRTIKKQETMIPGAHLVRWINRLFRP